MTRYPATAETAVPIAVAVRQAGSPRRTGSAFMSL